MTKATQTQEKKSEKIKIDKNLISDAFKNSDYRWFRCL